MDGQFFYIDIEGRVFWNKRSPDYENPHDGNADNVYHIMVVHFLAEHSGLLYTDSEGHITRNRLDITVTDADEPVSQASSVPVTVQSYHSDDSLSAHPKADDLPLVSDML